jgi:hypothetical protein
VTGLRQFDSTASPSPTPSAAEYTILIVILSGAQRSRRTCFLLFCRKGGKPPTPTGTAMDQMMTSADPLTRPASARLPAGGIENSPGQAQRSPGSVFQQEEPAPEGRNEPPPPNPNRSGAPFSCLPRYSSTPAQAPGAPADCVNECSFRFHFQLTNLKQSNHGDCLRPECGPRSLPGVRSGLIAHEIYPMPCVTQEIGSSF